MNNVSHIPSYLSPGHLGPRETFLGLIDRGVTHLAPDVRPLAPILPPPMRAPITAMNSANTGALARPTKTWRASSPSRRRAR